MDLKLNFNKKYTTIAIYACLVIVFAMLCVYFVINDTAVSNISAKVNDFMTPILVGLLITYLVNPIYNFFDRRVFAFIAGKNEAKLAKRLKLKHFLSLIVAYIILLSMVGAFFWIVIPQLILSINSLTAQVMSYIDPVREFIMSLETRTDTVGQVYKYIKPHVFDMDIVNNLPAYVSTIMTSISGWLISFISNTIMFVKYLLLGFFFSVYFLLYRTQTEIAFNRLLSAFFSEKTAKYISHVVSLIDQKFGHFLKGQSMDSIIIAILTWIVLSIFGFKYAVLIALIVGVTNMIPVFGPFLGAIPSAFLVLITEPEPFKMVLIFVIFILVLQQLDGNFLVPIILGDAIGLTPLWILIAITVMGSLFGILGMFIGVPTFAVIYTLISEAVSNRLDGKKEVVEVIPIEDYDMEFTECEQITIEEGMGEESIEEAVKENDPNEPLEPFVAPEEFDTDVLDTQEQEQAEVQEEEIDE